MSLTFEPGRRLTGEGGILVTRVIYIKESGGRRFAVVDAAMNDLVRPTLYEAWHDIELAADDLLAVRSAGAYGAVMSSTYNTRLLIPEVMVHGDEFAVIRPRPDYDTLIAQDSVPGWITDGRPS